MPKRAFANRYFWTAVGAISTMVLQIMWRLAGSQEQFSRITKVDSVITIEELIPTVVDDVTRPPQQQTTINDDEENFPLISLQQAVKEHLLETGGEQKVYLLFCSPNLKYLYFFSMHFPHLPCVAIAYDKVNSSELPPWSAPALVLKSSKCANHPYWKEAVRRRAASPKVEVTAEVESYQGKWIGGVHWPNISTSGMRKLADRPMILTTMGEVFWRDRYGPMNDVDVAIFRSKENPRPGSLTLHDVQGVSHSYRPMNNTLYTKEEGRALWTSHHIEENPFQYNSSNHKGF